MFKRTMTTLAVATLAMIPVRGQLRVEPIVGRQGELALELQLRRLSTVGTFMMTTAHPDDENNALLAQLGLGEGMRTVLVTATRGDGGQNEIGPELFDALAVLRTEELAAAHRFDGAEQYFTRAVDFGYSFSIDESYEKWGRREILGDFVRHIRATRPDVIAGWLYDGTGGGQHHQATAHLTREAFRAAADPTQFPEQFQEGLRPWQAKKVYSTAGTFGAESIRVPPSGGRQCRVDGNVYDAALGRTFAEIGMEARSMHKCQGASQLLALPGPSGRIYTLRDSVIGPQADTAETSVFEGVDTSLASLAQFAGAEPLPALTQALATLKTDVDEARAALKARGPAAAAAALRTGLADTQALRARLASLGLSDTARYEIDFRLAQKEGQWQQALVLAYGIEVDVLADDGLVVPGQPVTVSVVLPNRGAETARVTRIAFSGFEKEPSGCAAAAVPAGDVFRCEVTATVPADARLSDRTFRRLPDAARYVFEPDVPFGAPFRPTPYRVTLSLDLGGATVPVTAPVEFRYGSPVAGEKRHELLVVPKFAVDVTPDRAIIPAASVQATRAQAGAGAGRELRVTVVNASKGPARAEASLELPDGWKAAPASAPVTFAREDESTTVRFIVSPAAGVKPGRFTVRARVREAGTTYDQGYDVVEYPHTTRRHVLVAPEVKVSVLDVKIAPRLTVGYVMGVGDQVPPALEQLGATVEMIDPETLASGDLSRFDVVVTGVRAYEGRADLRAYNQRLLDYARNGGTVIVQYNKFEFNEAQYGPYPAKVSSNRVTDERAPIEVLVPQHPVFTTPNPIDASTWDGWVQERGLYFLGEKDARYVDLVRSADPFPYNAGAKTGALVEAPVGKGRWIYVGLNLWRQLPAGTEGAYKLMANLISLGRSGTAKVPTSSR